MTERFTKLLATVGAVLFVLGVASFAIGPFRGPWSQTYNSTWASVSIFLLIVGGMSALIALREYRKKGFDFYSYVADVKMDEERIKQRYKIESLYRKVGHTDEWLQGFAESFDFFASNYLSEENVGVTELDWWRMARESADLDPELLEESYRAFMVLSLMRKSEILDEEYIKIGYMVRDESVKELMGRTSFRNYILDSMKKENAMAFSDYKKEHPDG